MPLISIIPFFNTCYNSNKEIITIQTVPQQFIDMARGDVRSHSWGCRISFTKAYDDDITFFTLNQSLLNSGDILGTTGDNVLNAWDYYDYKDYTDRIVYMSWDRSLEFPFSIASARADFQLANTDKYFTPNSTSPIKDYILPKRPVRLLSGFRNMIIPQFVGLTQGMPSVNDRDGTATFTALDFLTQIYEMPIRNTILMVNARTDEVLAQILDDFGLTPNQYDLAKARNTIPFLFFTREQQTAGDVIRELMEAEGGMLWLGEDGVIRFRPRLEQPSVPVYELNDTEIVDIEVAEDTQIINQVIFSGEVRKLAGYQNIYSKIEGGEPNIVPAGQTASFFANLENPSIDIVVPTAGEQDGTSWFQATNLAGTNVGSVTVAAVYSFTNTYKIDFTNSNGFDVDIARLELFGNPAKVFKTIKEKVVDYQPSIDKYEANPVHINNNFIQTESQMESLALTILDDYAEYASIINAEIKGNPALSLGDIIEVNYKQYTGEYRIIGISSSLQQGKATQNVKLRSYEPRDYFVLNVSQLNSSAQLAP